MGKGLLGRSDMDMWTALVNGVLQHARVVRFVRIAVHGYDFGFIRFIGSSSVQMKISPLNVESLSLFVGCNPALVVSSANTLDHRREQPISDAKLCRCAIVDSN